jgi:hypothetical protein
MRVFREAALSLVLCAASAAAAYAAVPPLGLDELNEQATHVVTGKVLHVYTTQAERGEGMTDTLYVLELELGRLDKGEGPAAGEVLYALTWQPAERPEGWTGHQGQDGLPAVGQNVQLFLRRGPQGRYEVLTPNGILRVQTAAGGR